MQSGGVGDPSSDHDPEVEQEQEQEHDGEPEQSDAVSGLDRPFLTCGERAPGRSSLC